MIVIQFFSGCGVGLEVWKWQLFLFRWHLSQIWEVRFGRFLFVCFLRNFLSRYGDRYHFRHFLSYWNHLFHTELWFMFLILIKLRLITSTRASSWYFLKIVLWIIIYFLIIFFPIESLARQFPRPHFFLLFRWRPDSPRQIILLPLRHFFNISIRQWLFIIKFWRFVRPIIIILSLLWKPHLRFWISLPVTLAKRPLIIPYLINPIFLRLMLMLLLMERRTPIADPFFPQLPSFSCFIVFFTAHLQTLCIFIWGTSSPKQWAKKYK